MNSTQTPREPAVAGSPASGWFGVVHMSQSIRGPLLNWTPQEWKNATKWITRNDGTRYTAAELKSAFLDELAKGHEVVPIGECDNFDWRNGCMGHPVQTPNNRIS